MNYFSAWWCLYKFEFGHKAIRPISVCMCVFSVVAYPVVSVYMCVHLLARARAHVHVCVCVLWGGGRSGGRRESVCVCVYV